MKDVFLNKLENNEYISNYLYKEIKEKYETVIPKNFYLDKYNDEILEKEYQKNKEYFDNMYSLVDPNIHLDKEQIKAILSDEEYSLILAGAGTGKTTTIVSKVKYLVDIKKVEPEKIVVMSYTKKATEELEKRIVIDFEIPACVTTFHSLGLMHIREIFKNRKCYVVDESTRNQIFYDYFREKIFKDKEKLKELIDSFEIIKSSTSFLFGNHFVNNYQRFETFEEYFQVYKEDKIKEVSDIKEEVEKRIDKLINMENPLTIKNELVKSKGEAIIANFLYRNGIEYKYEKVYKETMQENRTYKPDFTLNLGGEEVYIEYFGMSNYKDNLERYEKIRKIKEDYHRIHNTRFIKLDYEKNENLEEHLKEELIKMGFVLKEKNYYEIFNRLLDNNPIAQIFSYKDLLYDVIDKIKSSSKRTTYKEVVEEYLKGTNDFEREFASRQFKYIDEFYHYYQEKLFSVENYGFDFSDMLYYANLYIEKIGTNNNLNFKYLIIDEYQDISKDRYEFTKRIVDRNAAKVIAVGDDWQSIFSFAGSKIEYIYNFPKYFKRSKLLKISKTYRNSQSLIEYSGKFIMKNIDQIEKNLISDKEIKNPIRFVLFEEDEEYDTLKRLILSINKQNSNHNIMILARTNKLISRCYDDGILKDEIGTKIEFVGYEDIEIDGMTIHKAKGLTSDEVILIGLNENFPLKDKTEYWLTSLFKMPKEEENIQYAEERRLFYVALTRTKNYVYLLVNKNPKLRSPFINEIYNIIKENGSF